MPIAPRTIKVLFAKSQNRCAYPDCSEQMIVGDLVLGEICHIRARRKNGPRYDPNLTAKERDAAANLVLLCPTCHSLVDKGDRCTFTVEWLEEIKRAHEAEAPLELSATDAPMALALLAKHQGKPLPPGFRLVLKTRVVAKAGKRGVAIAVGGDNHAPIHVNVGAPKATGGRGYRGNSLGSDAAFSGYIDYLVEMYVKYMRPISKPGEDLRGRIGKNIRDKFRLGSRTRNDLPISRFWDLVAFLYEKLAATPVGRQHASRGTKLYSTFDEWRTTTR